MFSLVQGLGDVPWRDLEATLNLGVGMVAVVGAAGADRALAELTAAGVPAWVLGEVTSGATDARGGDVVQGTKGVDGGSVRMHGSYRT